MSLVKIRLVLAFVSAWGMSVMAQTVPSIIVQPFSQSAASASTVTFTVSASGAGTLAYLWQKNTTNMANGAFSGRATVSGATTAALTLTGITTNDQANYACRITNSSGNITSTIATLSVIVAPVITSHPKSVNTNIGSAVRFSVVSSGTEPLAYQWYKDGVSIPNATLNAYSLSGITAGDAGTYVVRVSNGAGSAVSSNAFLNLGFAPAITADPTSLTVTQGQSATFTASAASDQPMNYYWRKNGTTIPGATNTTYTIPSAISGDGATYSLLASNLLGTATSSGAILTVLMPAAITVQPTSMVVGVGSNATFTVTTEGTSPVYQWYKNGTNIADATASSYSITSAQFSDAADYTVVVSNTVTSVTSQVATLTVQHFAPAITLQPFGGSQLVGSNFTFTVTATGTVLVYQWQKNGADMLGANGASLTLNNLAFTDAAAYMLIVTNAVGSVTSSPAILYVGYAPVIVQQPTSVTNAFGSNAVLTCIADGPLPMTYQWFQNGAALPDETNTALTLTNLQLQNVGSYQMIAGNAFGSITSYPAVLHLSPGIVIQPTNQTVMPGSAASFSIFAGGEAPLTYQWQLNGTNLSDNSNISGSTSSQMSMVAALTNTLGNYSVVLSNVYGTLTSAVAGLSFGYASQSHFRYLGFIQCYAVPSGVTNLGVLITGASGAGAGGAGTVKYARGVIIVTPGSELMLSVGGKATGISAGNTPITGFDGGSGGSSGFSPGGGGGAATLIKMADGGHIVVGGSGGGGGNGNGYPGGRGGSSMLEGNMGTIGANTAGGAGGNALSNGGSGGGGGGGALGGIGGAAGVNILPGAGGTGGGSLLPADYLYGQSQWTFGSGLPYTETDGSISMIPNPIPVITIQPDSKNVLAGNTTGINVSVTSPLALTYQWYKNGFTILNATNSSLSFSPMTPQDGGNYSVVTANTFASVTSSVATLTVNIPVYITSQPQGQAVLQGNNAGFTVVATGTPSLGYQWQKNGFDLPSATLTAYSIPSATMNDTGAYRVVITNASGSVTSSIANLLVGLPPQRLAINSASGQGIHLQLSGTPNFPYVLQSATNLASPVNWLPVITNLAGPTGDWIFTDTNTSQYPARFYRMTVP